MSPSHGVCLCLFHKFNLIYFFDYLMHPSILSQCPAQMISIKNRYLHILGKVNNLSSMTPTHIFYVTNITIFYENWLYLSYLARLWDALRTKRADLQNNLVDKRNWVGSGWKDEFRIIWEMPIVSLKHQELYECCNGLWNKHLVKLKEQRI